MAESETFAGAEIPVMTTPAVADQLGVSYRQLDFWARNGYLRPLGTGRGSGSVRLWLAPEIEIARRMAVLLRADIPLPVAAQFARESWPCGEIAPGIEIRVTEGTES